MQDRYLTGVTVGVLKIEVVLAVLKELGGGNVHAKLYLASVASCR